MNNLQLTIGILSGLFGLVHVLGRLLDRIPPRADFGVSIAFWTAFLASMNLPPLAGEYFLVGWVSYCAGSVLGAIIRAGLFLAEKCKFTGSR